MGVTLLAAILSVGFAFIYASILYWVDRYEKEPSLILGGVFVWGVLFAAGTALALNTVFSLGVYLITESEVTSEVMASIGSAPIVEESLKGLAVLVVFFFVRQQFDSITDGIVYAGVTALGFAASENILYLITVYSEGGWEYFWLTFLFRVILGAWNHAAYTSLFGIGLALARLSRSMLIKIGTPVAGFFLAILVHFSHNLLAQFSQSVGGLVSTFLFDWVGWGFIIIILIISLIREKNWIKEYLLPQINLGNITPYQYRVARSPARRFLETLKALATGEARTVWKFYSNLIRYAYKSHQYSRTGDPRDLIALNRASQDLGQQFPT
ncbi:MAG: PrsW family intramembrane metalloprotease [Anaerolineales bacterium]|nr:PrsW family intramembrane metalloprotease [Anaerolineales bacterium]